jgi:hypothetical protein
MSNYQKHAERELRALGYEIDKLEEQKEDPNKWICQNIFELLHTFGNQGHSGSSAPYVVNLFAKLAMFEPLCPLTGTDDEWNEVGTGVFQNKRCSHVFKENGATYDSEAVIFREPSGACFQNRDSRKPITFPYTPIREYVDVEATR